MNIEALVEKKLDKFLAVVAKDRVLEYRMLDIDLRVIVSLEDFRQCQIFAVPVQSEAQISVQLQFAEFALQLRLSLNLK